jgi:hypothetical protein
MNKTIAVMLLTASIFLTGCAANQEKQTPQQPAKVIESNTFNHDLFSIELPAPYTSKDSVIQPKSEKDFPTIVFSSSKEKAEAGKLLESEKEWFKSLWSQTGPSGKFISSENVTLDGKNGIKFTVQYQGRSLDDRNGYLNEYYYSILNSGNLFRFWTSASDLENPEEVSKIFDKIIETISFK